MGIYIYAYVSIHGVLPPIFTLLLQVWGKASRSLREKHTLFIIDYTKEGITNTLALPIDQDVVHLLHTLNTKNVHSDLNTLNTFTKETSSCKVKLVLIR